MKGYKRMIRTLLLWEVSLMLLITPACTIPALSNPIEQHKVYFVASGSEGFQIWQINADGTDSRVIYEMYRSLERSASAVLPRRELSLLEDYLASITPTLTSDQVYLTPGIRDMRLSPSRRILAWVAGDFGCHTRGAQIGCFGVQRLTSFDISTGVEHVYWQATVHQAEDPHLPVPGITTIAWSPDSRYIAFGQYYDRSVPCTPELRIVDVQTQEIRDVGIGGGLLAWSPDGRYLASIDCGIKGEIIRVHNVGSDQVQEFSFGNLDLIGSTITWSSQFNQIAFTAVDTNEKVHRAKLYVLDAEMGDIQDVLESEGESYETPQWSPDGRLLAVEVRPESGDFTKLLILDPKSKTEVAQLLAEHVIQSWQCGADGESILLLLGEYNNPSSLSLGIFSIETNDLTYVPLPSPVEDALSSRESGTFFRSYTVMPKDNVILRISQPNW